MGFEMIYLLTLYVWAVAMVMVRVVAPLGPSRTETRETSLFMAAAYGRVLPFRSNVTPSITPGPGR